MAQWIWKFGEFEIYHNMLVHNRRIGYGYHETPMWKIYAPSTNIEFSKEVNTAGGVFKITVLGYHTLYIDDAIKYGISEVTLEPGVHRVKIVVSNPESFPALYIDGVISTDETWFAAELGALGQPAASYPAYDTPDKRPDVFPFAYEPMQYVSKEEINGSVLFDFGKETFCKTHFIFPEAGKYFISFGESREEALDRELSYVHVTADAKDGTYDYVPTAFRYIYVDCAQTDVAAEYQYLPLEYRGAFRCDEAVVNKVWDMSAYTFHLNTREFLLDGIKRDRWVWSADAYQSMFVNRYLFLDADVEKRTLIALGGKLPVVSHRNNIIDYTFFWIIAIYDYYMTYGDSKFVNQIYPQAKAIMDFSLGRLDDDGFTRCRELDFVFIDWASRPLDKTGAVCGAQILLAKALECFARLTELTGCDGSKYVTMAKRLQQTILDKFYDSEKGAFIDSYESGNRYVSRQSNCLAYLYLPLTQEMKDGIYERVILNDEMCQITTPYFKFYENQVHCEQGNLKLFEESMRVYYGSMIDFGATTLFEQYDPNEKGIEHYAMYGGTYQRSLCHAWSASPIYLLGRYHAGVRNTGVAYNTFEVKPDLGDLNSFDCTVPLPKGIVRVKMDKETLSVFTNAEGGTLIVNCNTIPLEPNKEIIRSL